MTKYQITKDVITVIFTTSLLLILYNFSNNQRYVVSEEPLLILDTRTGTTYYPKVERYIEIKDFQKQTKSK